MAKAKRKTQAAKAQEANASWTRFFKETKMEMKKVIWPEKHQMVHCRHRVRDFGFIPDRCSRLRIQWPLQIVSTRCGLKGERLCRIWKLKTRM